MRAIELVGQVDNRHQLHLEVPPDVRPGLVKVTVEWLDEFDDELSNAWARAIGQLWAADWSDPREDIYTLEDGEPVDDKR